jgi:hypothetical protein
MAEMQLFLQHNGWQGKNTPISTIVIDFQWYFLFTMHMPIHRRYSDEDVEKEALIHGIAFASA